MRLLALALVAGCAAPAPKLADFESAAGHAALSAWRRVELPDPVTASCDTSRFYVRLEDAAGFERTCYVTSLQAAGCLTWTWSREFFRPTQYPVVVVSPEWRSEPEIIIHELMHAMAKCSGLEAFGDPLHIDPRIWTAAGGDTSVQSRAMHLLTGQP